MKLSDLDMKELIPMFMRNDDAVAAFCRAVNKLLEEPCQNISTLRTWDQFDNFSEKECDEMAWELDVDWYDFSAALPEKRETIKYAQEIKRRRGTKWAVEQLVSAYFGDGKVTEWYEEGEEPFTFSISSENPNITPEMFVKFIQAVNAAKNERSKMSKMTHEWNLKKEIQIAPEVRVVTYATPICGAWFCGQEA